MLLFLAIELFFLVVIVVVVVVIVSRSLVDVVVFDVFVDQSENNIFYFLSALVVVNLCFCCVLFVLICIYSLN